MDQPSGGTITCPQCMAVNNHGSSQCFLCDRSLAGRPPDAKGGAASTPRRGGAFHLSTLMSFIALVAIYLGVFVSAPWLGVTLALPCVVGLIWAFSLPSRLKSRESPSTLAFVSSFFTSFSATLLLMVASVAAFFATCLTVISASGEGGPRGGGPIELGMVCGGIAAVVAPISILFLVVRLRRSARRPPPTGGDS